VIVEGFIVLLINAAPWAFVFSKSLRRSMARTFRRSPINNEEDLERNEAIVLASGIIGGLSFNILTFGIALSNLLQR
jgi:hypothetical protein